MPYSDRWTLGDLLESGWNKIYGPEAWDFIKTHGGSRTFDFLTDPLLPEELPEWATPESPKFQQAAKGVYKGVARPLSAPINAFMLPLAYGTALRGLGGVIKTGHTIQPGKKIILTPGMERINKALYGATLSSPGTTVRAGLGSIGGTATDVVQKLLHGDIANAAGTVHDVLNPFVSVPNWIKGFKQGTRIQSRLTHPISQKGPLSIFPRLMSATDEVFTQAMSQHGTPEEIAHRLTLAGTPETNLGRVVLDAIRRNPILNLAIPFPRVGIHAIEQSALLMPRKHPFRFASSLGMGGLAGYYGDRVDPLLTPYVGALAGPFTLPVSAGLAFRHAFDAGRNPQTAMYTEIGRNIPYPMGLQPIAAYSPSAIVREFTPNLNRDFARAKDPYERELGAPPAPENETPKERELRLLKNFFTHWSTTQAKIPGMREQLPPTGRRRDVYGRSIAGRELSPTKRFWTSEPYLVDTTPNTPEIEALQDIGVNLDPPRYSRDISIKGFKFPMEPDEAELYQEEQVKLREPLIKFMEQSPEFKLLPPEQRAYVADQFIERFDKINRQLARQQAIMRMMRRSRKGNP